MTIKTKARRLSRQERAALIAKLDDRANRARSVYEANRKNIDRFKREMAETGVHVSDTAIMSLCDVVPVNLMRPDDEATSEEDTQWPVHP